MSDSSPKRRFLLYGNCQSIGIFQQLRANPAVTAHFDIQNVLSFGDPPPGNPLADAAYLRSLDGVIWQTAAGFPAPGFIEHLRPDCRQFRYPALSLKFLWPLHCSDPRNHPEEGMPYGRYPYGDSLVLRLLNQGIPAAEIRQQYLDTDLRKLFPLDRLLERSFAELRHNDLQSDFAVAPLLEASFRQRQLFATINHPNRHLFDVLYRHILAFLLGTAPDLTPSADLKIRYDIFGDEEIPLHPQVISHFALSWCRPDQRWRYRSAYLTHDEYIEAYAHLTAIPFGSSPRVWMDRAQQACRHGNFPEAEFILFEAATIFPTILEFLLTAARLAVRQNRLLDAEKILRYHLQANPDYKPIHEELARVMNLRERSK